MTDQPNANPKRAHLTTGGAMTQEAEDPRAVALCEVVLRAVESFDAVPAGFELCPTCRELHANRLDKSARFSVSVVVGEPVSDDAEPTGRVVCEDCSRAVPLSADGTNHIFGEQVGDVRPCKVAFNIEVTDGNPGAAVAEALEAAQGFARAERVNFVVYEVTTNERLARDIKLRYLVRRESLKMNFELFGARAKVAKTVEPLKLEVGATELEDAGAAAPPVEAPPLALSLDALDVADDSEPTRGEDEGEAQAAAEAVSKKVAILDLWENHNVRDIAELVRRVKARPSYVAQVLQQAGHLDGFFDLYTTTGREQNVYTRYFRNVLHFRNVEAARESVARIDRLYNYFERLGDRAGQHQAMILALTGKNRARWSGKLEESAVFSEWLNAH